MQEKCWSSLLENLYSPSLDSSDDGQKEKITEALTKLLSLLNGDVAEVLSDALRTESMEQILTFLEENPRALFPSQYKLLRSQFDSMLTLYGQNRRAQAKLEQQQEGLVPIQQVIVTFNAEVAALEARDKATILRKKELLKELALVDQERDNIRGDKEKLKIRKSLIQAQAKEAKDRQKGLDEVTFAEQEVALLWDCVKFLASRCL